MSTVSAVYPDIEFSSELNRAATTSGSGQFKLLLASLEQNYLARLQIGDANTDTTKPAQLNSLYPITPLAPSESDWQYLQPTSELISQGHLASAKLWQAMHPEPLSQFNDPQFVDPSVVANMAYPAQQRYKHAQQNTVEPDPTALYDILNSLNPDSEVQAA